jgi:hypothetical protein
VGRAKKKHFWVVVVVGLIVVALGGEEEKTIFTQIKENKHFGKNYQLPRQKKSCAGPGRWSILTRRQKKTHQTCLSFFSLCFFRSRTHKRLVKIKTILYSFTKNHHRFSVSALLLKTSLKSKKARTAVADKYAMLFPLHGLVIAKRNHYQITP